MLPTVPNSRLAHMQIKNYTGNDYQHRPIFRNHQKRTRQRLNTTWGDRAESKRLNTHPRKIGKVGTISESNQKSGKLNRRTKIVILSAMTSRMESRFTWMLIAKIREEPENTLDSLPKRSEEDVRNSIGEMGVQNNNRNGDVSVRRCSRKFKPPESFVSKPFNWTENQPLLLYPKQVQREPRRSTLMANSSNCLKLRSNRWQVKPSRKRLLYGELRWFSYKTVTWLNENWEVILKPCWLTNIPVCTFQLDCSLELAFRHL